ncbi:MAG: Mut7-C RNAse domain-containing protein [Nitrososphaerota archaeon]
MFQLSIEPRFVVDGMLGGLSRWLRMLGYEAYYSNNASDDVLLELTVNKNAILLTRDVELYTRAKARSLEAFIVEGANEAERLALTASRFGLRLEINTKVSRCPTCNGSLREAQPKEISDKIPVGTRAHYNQFWICICCGKVYWQGGHWKKINETLRRARELLDINR